MANASSNDSPSEQRPDAIELVQQLDPHFPLTHLERVLYPEHGLRKAELIAYYTAVADWLLPHVAQRPLVLLRGPEGRRKSCFFQRHLAPSAPAAICRVTIREARGQAVYGFVEDLEGLVALAELGAVEIHSWACHVSELEKPDLLVFVLDPDPELPFERVATAAFALRERLAVLGLESFAQSSGDRALHVVAPVQPKHGWREHKAFACGVLSALAKAEPERYATNARQGASRRKIALGYRGNGRGARTIAPYSPRAREGVLIASPLSWRELEQGARPEQFDLRGVIRKLEQNPGDPWPGFWQLTQTLPDSSLRKRLAVA